MFGYWWWWWWWWELKKIKQQGLFKKDEFFCFIGFLNLFFHHFIYWCWCYLRVVAVVPINRKSIQTLHNNTTTKDYFNNLLYID